MVTIADAEKHLEMTTSLLATLNKAITKGTPEDIRSALIKAYDYYIDKFDANFGDFAQAPSASFERMAYSQMDQMKEKRRAVNQSKLGTTPEEDEAATPEQVEAARRRQDEAMRAEAETMLNALKSAKKVIELQLRALQPAGGRRRKTYRRKTKKRTTRKRRSF
jgi:hypothetical protein